jgi:hypothetical protein
MGAIDTTQSSVRAEIGNLSRRAHLSRAPFRISKTPARMPAFKVRASAVIGGRLSVVGFRLSHKTQTLTQNNYLASAIASLGYFTISLFFQH